MVLIVVGFHSSRKHGKNRPKMEILETYKFMEYLIALNAFQDLGQAIRAAFVSCLISVSLLFTFINLIENVSDFSAAIESVLILSGYTLLFPMYLHMIFNRTRFTVFLNELNGIVNDSRLLLQFLKKVENQNTLFFV